VMYYGAQNVGGYKAYSIPESSNTITAMATKDIIGQNQEYGRGAGFLGQDIVALFHLDDVTSPQFKGGIDILEYKGGSWNSLHVFDPPTHGFDIVSKEYRYGQRLVVSGSLIFVSSNFNTLHALHFNGTHLNEIGFYDDSSITKNFGTCGSTCNPPPMHVIGNRLIVPGPNVTYFDITFSCISGYSYNSSKISCEDVDECISGTHLCSQFRVCMNTDGGYICGNCSAGYANNGSYDCMNIDECATGTHQCSLNPKRDCMDEIGSYSCGPCPQGYVDNGPYLCSDVNECINPQDNQCSKNPDRECLNNNGSYTCGNCATGYIPDGDFLCKDADECAGGTHLCSKTPVRPCINQAPGYICGDCPAGFSIMGDYNCKDDSTTATTATTATNTQTSTTGSTTGTNTGTTTKTGTQTTSTSVATTTKTDKNSAIQIFSNIVFSIVMLLVLF